MQLLVEIIDRDDGSKAIPFPKELTDMLDWDEKTLLEWRNIDGRRCIVQSNVAASRYIVDKNDMIKHLIQE